MGSGTCGANLPNQLSDYYKLIQIKSSVVKSVGSTEDKSSAPENELTVPSIRLHQRKFSQCCHIWKRSQLVHLFWCQVVVN